MGSSSHRDGAPSASSAARSSALHGRTIGSLQMANGADCGNRWSGSRIRAYVCGRHPIQSIRPRA